MRVPRTSVKMQCTMQCSATALQPDGRVLINEDMAAVVSVYPAGLGSMTNRTGRNINRSTMGGDREGSVFGTAKPRHAADHPAFRRRPASRHLRVHLAHELPPASPPGTGAAGTNLRRAVKFWGDGPAPPGTVRTARPPEPLSTKPKPIWRCHAWASIVT